MEENRERFIALELAKKLANLDVNNEGETFVKNVRDLFVVAGASPWQVDQLQAAVKVIFNIDTKTTPPVW